MSELTAARILAAVADAAQRWRDADFPPRVRATAAVVARTGYSDPVVDYALDRLFESIDRGTVAAAIASELGSTAALGGFVTRPGRPDVFFRGVPRAAIVASDTTIGVALPAFVFALCANVLHVTVKDRSDRLIASFAETLFEEEPALRERVTVAPWNGTGDAAGHAELGEADVVVVYGGDGALRAVRALLRPDARFVPFGHRTSVGYVGRETLATSQGRCAAARGAARDALLYDGDGCLSLHALFVECADAAAGAADDDATQFARDVATACDALSVEFPVGARGLDPALAAYRRNLRFRAALGNGAVYGDPSAAHVVALEKPGDQPPPLVPRALALYPVAGPEEALAFLRRHRLPLEGFALAPGARPDLDRLALGSGAARIAALGTLQAPPLGGDHGGEGRILPFVRAIYRG